MSYESHAVDVTDAAKAHPIAPSRWARLRSTGLWGLDILFPWRCVHCEGVVHPPDRGCPSDFLCPTCRGNAKHSPPRLCRSCGSPAARNACEDYGSDGHGGEGHGDEVLGGVVEPKLCPRCVDRQEAGTPLPLDGVLWCWSYEAPISTAVTAMKFRGLDYLADKMVASALDHLQGRLPELDVIVPVPLHWSRRWARGYDQAELLAVGLSGRLGLARRHWLRRARRTSAQSLLNETERRANLASAFRVRRDPRVRDQRILLVDDVVTTGATLEAAAGALKEAGASQIYAFAVARTPQPGEPSLQCRVIEGSGPPC